MLELLGEQDKGRIEKLIKDIERLKKDYLARQEFWRKELTEGKMKTTLISDSYTPAMEFYKIVEKEFIPAIIEGNIVKARSLAYGDLRQRYEIHRSHIDSVVQMANEWNKLNEHLAATTIKDRYTMLLLIKLVIMALTIALAVLIVRDIIVPLKETVRVAEQIASGNLTVTIPKTERKDEAGDLLKSLNKMSNNLRDILRQIDRVSHKLVACSPERLSLNASEISNSAELQSQKIIQVATAAEEMSESITNVARNASEAAEASKDATIVALKGEETVQKTMQGMEDIAKSVRHSSYVISELGNRSDEIGKIIKVIDDIADQTNLLALNAAIEAARAGEQGRGFAVVADEVRRLAERTSNATKEIGDMIQAVQNDTGRAVESMEEGIKEVDKGVTLAKKTEDALNEIVKNIEKVTGMVEQIAATSEEQSATANQISGDIDAVARITKDTAGGANKIASTSRELAELVTELQTVVAGFNLSVGK